MNDQFNNTITTGERPITSDECTSAMLAYLLAFFTIWIGPMIIYLIHKNKSTFVTRHALQAFRFEIAIFLLGVVFGAEKIHGFNAIGLINLVFCAIAGSAALRGEWYEIPTVAAFGRKKANH